MISRATVKRGHRMYVKLGETEVEFNPKFRLFLHTKLSNPHYPPEIQAETTLVNFGVTFEGLEDQLLALTVLKERPDWQSAARNGQASSFLVKMKSLRTTFCTAWRTQKVTSQKTSSLSKDSRTQSAFLSTSRKSLQGKIIQHHISETSEKYRSTATRCVALLPHE